MRYKAILLDFYGTLVEEDGAIIARIVRQVCVESPLRPDRAEVIRSWEFAELCSESYADTFEAQRTLELRSLRALLEKYDVPLDPVALSQDLFDYWRAPRACPSASGFLSSLRIPAAIVSNIDDEDLSRAILHNGWHFDVVVTSQQCRAYKPRPELFQEALSRLGLSPEDVIHVGDSLRADVKGAQDVGIDTIWVNRKGRSPSSDASPPSFIVSHVGEASQILS